MPLPRLSLVTPGTDPDPSTAGLAMLAGLAALKWRVQHYRAWAPPIGSDLPGIVTGRPGRHLDAWLMPPEVLRSIFRGGAERADLAIVEGTFDPREIEESPTWIDRPGPLVGLTDALDLPRVAVIDYEPIRDGHLPYIPAGIEAVLIDRLDRPESFPAARSLVTNLARRPVLGAIEALPEDREAIVQARPGGPPPLEALARLGSSFLKFADLDAIRSLARSRPWPVEGVGFEPEPISSATVPASRRLRVAYAMDEAFGGYFPDTLEAIESLGSELVEFSPLRDGALPSGVDLVMIGGGRPELHAEALAANHSLIAELRMHVCRGLRIYSEGGGTAYLSRSLIREGRQYPMAGILPVSAEFLDGACSPRPVERRLTRDGWLGPRGALVRGYRSGRWALHPAPEPDDCPAKSGPLTAENDLYFRKGAIGSLVHLHLGALPEVVAAFAGASAYSASRPGSRS